MMGLLIPDSDGLLLSSQSEEVYGQYEMRAVQFKISDMVTLIRQINTWRMKWLKERKITVNR